MKQLEIRMLGEFTLRAGDNQISDTETRARKVWALLACLLCHRDRVLSQQRLMELLWGEETGSANPENALRITMHRLRRQLDALWPDAGRELILRQEGGYSWNWKIPVWVDAEQFEQLCSREAAGDQRLEDLLEALELFRGEFLPRQSSELWAVPLAAHLHNRYVEAVQEAAQCLLTQGRPAEAAVLCRGAIGSEPYHEPLHCLLMQALGAQGDPRGAAGVYETLSRRLFDDFGIRPGAQTRAVYRTVAHNPGDRTLPMEEVLAQLQEPQGPAGAMTCDYDYFKVLCFAESRAMERTGEVVHVGLLSLGSAGEHPLSRRTMNRIMEQLGTVLRLNLRRGDVISRCSTTQYIILLPQANYENSCMVCRRVIAAFTRAHPHTAAKIHFMVQPLSPALRVP